MSRPLVRFEYSTSREDALHRAATEWGVEREFWDIFGHHHIASAETEARILSSLGVDVNSTEQIDAARRRRFERKAASVVPGTSVISERGMAFELSLLSGELPPVEVELLLEEGTSITYVPDPSHLVP